MQPPQALRTQQAISRGRAHGQQLCSTFWSDLHLLMPFEHFQPDG
jgi:hypothetical protein